MPDPDGFGIWHWLLLLALLALCGLFAAAETAVVMLSDGKIKKMAEEGDQRAQKILAMTAKPTRFLSTVQLGVTLATLLTAMLSAAWFVRPLQGWLGGFGWPEGLARLGGWVLLAAALTLCLLVLGEIVPKRLAMHRPEQTAFGLLGFLRFFFVLLRPVVALVNLLSGGLIRLLGIDPEREPQQVTEEEIRMMVDVGNEKGAIEESEREMINNIFEFDDRPVSEVMTHRTELVAVEKQSAVPEVATLALKTGFSRIPVYEEDVDNIVGILYVKDMLRYVAGQNAPLQSVGELARPAIYVPETSRCDDLFQEFNQKKVQMAIVVDEYGGTSGVVTMEDLLEAIVGNMQDEYDDEQEAFSQLSEDEFLFDGAVSLEEAEKVLGVRLADEEADYDTLGGLVMDLLGYIPAPEEHPAAEASGFRFIVEQVEERRIARIRAVRLPKGEEQTAPSAEEA